MYGAVNALYGAALSLPLCLSASWVSISRNDREPAEVMDHIVFFVD